MAEHYDIAIIGAGMAGASLAAELAPFAKVLLAEAEDLPGYHATGRSAAFWEECYGGPDITPLTRASYDYLNDLGCLRKRGALYIGRDQDEAAISAFERSYGDAGVSIERIGRAELQRAIGGLKAEWTTAISQPDCSDIDVGALHQHYLSQAKRLGVELRCRAPLASAEREGSGWRLAVAGADIRANIVVNAAGAWADTIAKIAGVAGLGITPFRRTVAQLRVNPPARDDLPLVLDINGQFYFKPDNARLWVSPHDETPSAPCDAAAEEVDVAHAISRIENVVDWPVEAVERKWAGLRSFAPDRLPVYGFDRANNGFFWFAGQGGFGIQTAPAAAKLGAQLLLGEKSCALTASLNADLYSPTRFE